MIKRTAMFLTLSLAVLYGTGSAWAHHGYAAYDETTTLSLKATITSFEMQNPHSTINFTVTDEHGKTEDWVAEGGNVRLLVEEGWTRDILKPGDKVTIYFHPAKNGSHAVNLEKVELPDGRSLWAHTSHDKPAN
jgi:hypothetical protein